ncbi:hypothetical protein Droror1_Dr00019722 [Drosera rotundifolia]
MIGQIQAVRLRNSSPQSVFVLNPKTPPSTLSNPFFALCPPSPPLSPPFLSAWNPSLLLSVVGGRRGFIVPKFGSRCVEAVAQERAKLICNIFSLPFSEFSHKRQQESNHFDGL